MWLSGKLLRSNHILMDYRLGNLLRIDRDGCYRLSRRQMWSSRWCPGMIPSVRCKESHLRLKNKMLIIVSKTAYTNIKKIFFLCIFSFDRWKMGFGIRIRGQHQVVTPDLQRLKKFRSIFLCKIILHAHPVNPLFELNNSGRYL